MRQNLELHTDWDGNLWHYRNLGRANAIHHHAELEFNLIVQGSGLYLLDNRKYQVRRGDLLWLFPKQEHVLIEQTLDFEMWIGVCKPKAVRRIATDTGAKTLREANPTGEFCRRLNQSDLAQLENILNDVAAIHDQPGLFNAGLAYALLTAWQHFENAADVLVHDIHPAVEKAARLIRDETTALSLDELAGRAGLSAHRLSRLFKRQTGVALVDFRNRQRIESFLRLYGTGQRMKMLDAALEAGFGSYPQFHRVFKKVMGRSPRSQRQPHRPDAAKA